MLPMLVTAAEISDHSQSLKIAGGVSIDDRRPVAADQTYRQAQRETQRLPGPEVVRSGYPCGWISGLSRRVGAGTGLYRLFHSFAVRPEPGATDRAHHARDGQPVFQHSGP